MRTYMVMASTRKHQNAVGEQSKIYERTIHNKKHSYEYQKMDKEDG